MWVALTIAKATHIFSAKIYAYKPYLKISFNNMLTNDVVSFEQLGPVCFTLARVFTSLFANSLAIFL